MAANNSVLIKWSNIIAFALTVIVNSLAGSTTLIGGVNTAQVSDSNPTLICPAATAGFQAVVVTLKVMGAFPVFFT